MFLIIRSFVFNNFFQKNPENKPIESHDPYFVSMAFFLSYMSFFESVKEKKIV